MVYTIISFVTIIYQSQLIVIPCSSSSNIPSTLFNYQTELFYTFCKFTTMILKLPISRNRLPVCFRRRCAKEAATLSKKARTVNERLTTRKTVLNARCYISVLSSLVVSSLALFKLQSVDFRFANGTNLQT